MNSAAEVGLVGHRAGSPGETMCRGPASMSAAHLATGQVPSYLGCSISSPVHGLEDGLVGWFSKR